MVETLTDAHERPDLRALRRHTALAVAVLGALVTVAAASASRTAAERSVYGSLIPKPVSAVPARGAFALTPTVRILVSPGSGELRRVGSYLAGLLEAVTGVAPAVTAARGARPAGAILLTTTKPKRALGSEGYELTIAPAAVTLAAHRPAGIFRGIQTLRQLLPAGASGRPAIPAGTVRDRPRFPWRGVMLDVARHFFGVDDVKRLVDLAALYKLNRLHLHLTDDQGWRIAIRGWPRLTAHGGRTAVGGGPGGHFTQAQYAEIVRHAASRYVVVVPEIEMPGHTNAALSSYPQLTCDGVAPPLRTDVEVGFSSLCLGKPATERFVRDVLAQVAALTPGPYLHVGGDEAAATDPADYAGFIAGVERIVRSHRKRLVGWEEVAAVPLHRASIVQHWQSDVVRRAADGGSSVIMSPASKTYLDMKYHRRSALGLRWAGYTNVQAAYAWDPATQVDGVREEAVLGIEAPLWTETAVTRADLDHLVFPRLLGHAEIGWSPRAGRGWSEYRLRLAAQAPRLEELGVGFYRSPEVPWR